jgi:hypothetical protein
MSEEELTMMIADVPQGLDLDLKGVLKDHEAVVDVDDSASGSGFCLGLDSLSGFDMRCGNRLSEKKIPVGRTTTKSVALGLVGWGIRRRGAPTNSELEDPLLGRAVRRSGRRARRILRN